MEEKIYQITHTGYSIITEKKSRFIGQAQFISGPEEALEVLGEIKKKYYDARHRCYAYVLGEGEKRSADDGEPSGTAGRPILDVIEGMNLVYALIVVTRYFGGILLGTGGLSRAYGAAAKAALEEARLIERRPGVEFDLSFGYDLYGSVERLLQSAGAHILGSDFGKDVSLHVICPQDRLESLTKKLVQLSGGKAVIEGEKRSFYGIEENKILIL